MPLKTPLKVVKKRTKTSHPGPPKGSANHMVHGCYASFADLDRRYKLPKLMGKAKTMLIDALGSDLSPQELMLADRAVFKMAKCMLYEQAYMTGGGNPDTAHYLALANSLRLDLQALGLGRRAKQALDLKTYISEKYGQEKS